MTSAHGAVAAAAKKKRQQQEEEEMTKYTKDELNNDWEFKIVKSASGQFNKREAVEQVRAEESIAGWVMVEKFDEYRIRFKRPASAQRNDYNLPPGIDPYRTTYGISEGALVVTILGIVGGVVGLIVLLVNLFS